MGVIVSLLKLIDRRVIFIITFLAVVLPMFFPLHLPIKPEKAVISIYDKMNSIPEGSHILMSFDYDPASKPECHPMAIATLRHAFEKNLKVVIVQLWPFGGSMAMEALSEVKKEFVKEYGRDLEEGKDYVIIGYKAGGALVIQQAGEDFNGTFQEDINGKKLSELPITKDVKTLADFKLILSYSAGDPGIKQWIMIAYSQYKVPVAGGVTAVTAPEISPFLSSGQLLGLMAGLKGAADYETLLNKDYPVFTKYINSATMGMESQNIVHLMIMVFIIIANIIYWYDKKHGLER
jgi:hypothetical protein